MNTDDTLVIDRLYHDADFRRAVRSVTDKLREAGRRRVRVRDVSRAVSDLFDYESNKAELFHGTQAVEKLAVDFLRVEDDGHLAFPCSVEVIVRRKDPMNYENWIEFRRPRKKRG
jgi:hypothetical protein